MALSFRTARPDDVEEICEADARAFGVGPFAEDEVARIRDQFDLSRFVVVRDSDQPKSPVVAAAGNFSLEVTLPGPAVVPMAGVTWVSVAATHRRRGVASKMMAWLERDARKHNEPVTGLMASEGAIYERFGFGVCTRTRVFSIDRRRVEMLDRFRADTSSIQFVDHIEELPTITRQFDKYRRSQPGEVSMPSWLAREVLAKPSDSQRVVCALHPNGFAIWAISPDWNDGDPQHGLRVWMVCALNDEAHRALWTLILSTDLVGVISGRSGLGPDDPLPYLVTNPRGVKTTDLSDNLWLKVLDPAAAFAARSYRTDDSFVLDLGAGERMRVSPDGVGAAPRRKYADLTLSPSAVGPLLLGSVSASVLSTGGRLQALSPSTLARADAFFGVSPEPFCQGRF